MNWLQTDLAAHPNKCTLAYWHHARFSEGPDTAADPAAALAMQPFWATLVNAGAEILITGHDHMYQRFAPMDASGNVDPAGMREFVSGRAAALLQRRSARRRDPESDHPPLGRPAAQAELGRLQLEVPLGAER